MKRKKNLNLFLTSIISMTILSAITACSLTKSLLTEEIKANKIAGSFSLILYSNRFSGDFENVAFLDVEGDQYKIEIFAPDFDYEIVRNLPADKAIRKAEQFIASHGSFKYAQVSQIKDPYNNVIGYEFRPLYSASQFGFFDVLDIDYRLEGNKIIVKISLVPEVKRFFLNDDISTLEPQ